MRKRKGFRLTDVLMSIPAHIVASSQNLLTTQQTLENALTDISDQISRLFSSS